MDIFGQLVTENLSFCPVFALTKALCNYSTCNGDDIEFTFKDEKIEVIVNAYGINNIFIFQKMKIECWSEIVPVFNKRKNVLKYVQGTLNNVNISYKDSLPRFIKNETILHVLYTIAYNFNCKITNHLFENFIPMSNARINIDNFNELIFPIELIWNLKLNI